MARHRTVPALFPPPGYAHTAVVEAGERLVFLAGSVPLDADGKLVGPGDHVAQTRQVLANLETALAAAGSSLPQVVASTVYVVAAEPGPLSEVWEVVNASGLAEGPHTSTLLGVACLGYTGQLVEITVTAVASGAPAVEG
ncbi:RidA family protein [Kitasatospora sp. GP82]|uniref:RidA family protein n=1 Tax=Kitasatospora sp. GP82 TaxID=3035089 RepID=UPI002475416B|nr:RidA family protein [Kitasatospora sp. GP82]MDH6127820.1 enamine deaminase RidA (YjgF/YER057c/UK114 family) [Kitasatospora sp. GP82]